jgi:pimeloyl-ACP methyl ester carboxylesterase
MMTFEARSGVRRFTMVRQVLPSVFSLFLFGCALHDGVWVRSGFAPVPGGELYYETAGNGAAVVLIHGGGMDRRMWDPQFTRLARDFRVVRYDVHGFGKSPMPERGYSNCDDLAALLTHLDIDRADIVGLSLGGRIAIDFALAHPQRVHRLVPVAPGLSGYDWSQEQGERLTKLFYAARDESVEAAAELWLQDPYMAPACEDPQIEPVIRRIVMDNATSVLRPFYLERPLDPPADQRLGEIQAATLVIVGDRDVPDILQIVDKLAAEVPGARKEVIAGAGHIVNMEKPAEFDALLLDFLRAGD